jgi:hypothetical protein
MRLDQLKTVSNPQIHGANLLGHQMRASLVIGTDSNGSHASLAEGRCQTVKFFKII